MLACGGRWGRCLMSDPDAALARLVGLADELVKQPGRSTLVASAAEHGLRFARVPVGDTCPWCKMLGSRGFVYRSREAAGDMRSFHRSCDCRIAVEGEDVPDYDPDALMDLYLRARDAAGSGDPGSIMAAWRELEAAGKMPAYLPGLSIDGLDDAAADALMSRLMEAGDFDGAARVGELLDARSAASEAEVAQQIRDMRQDFHPAAYEWYENLSEDDKFAYLDQYGDDQRLMEEFLQEQWSWANGGTAAKRAVIPTEREIRAEWEDYIYAETLRIENATRGVSLTKKARADGRRISDLLRVNEQTARSWASEETRRYWDANGRLTYAAFKAGYTGDDEAIRRSRKAYWA